MAPRCSLRFAPLISVQVGIQKCRGPTLLFAGNANGQVIAEKVVHERGGTRSKRMRTASKPTLPQACAAAQMPSGAIAPLASGTGNGSSRRDAQISTECPDSPAGHKHGSRSPI